MPADKAAVPAPMLDPIVLPELQAGDGYDLEPSASLEAFAFESISTDAVQLGGARIESCRVTGLHAAEAELRGTTIIETVLEHLDIPVLRASRTRWRDVRIEGGRLGSAELYDADWESVEFVGCKLSFVNLRGSTLRDVRFTDCTIEELDLGAAEVLRLALPGTRIRRLDVSRATLQHADLRGCEFADLTGAGSLRGAAIDADQLALLAPLFASELGIAIIEP
jgi:uncharacterized protein YjbI with pentapeptide repeats